MNAVESYPMLCSPPALTGAMILANPNRFDVYYGMADNQIDKARLDLPEILPPEGVADPPEVKV